MDMSDLNIYQRINAVMRDITYVKKDTSVTGGGSYKAVSHDMVVAVIRKSMVNHGIVVRMEQTSGKFEQMRDPKADIKMHLYSGKYRVDFVNIDKPDDVCTVHVHAHANDNGDKAPGKAASYAVKYAMLKTFSLETGENDESRTYEEPKHTDIQQDEFYNILDKKDGIGLAVFARKYGPDCMLSLQQTFPDGKISQLKKLCKDLESEGWDTLRKYQSDISEAVDKDDVGYLSQIAQELTPDEKKVLAGILRPMDITALKRATEA